MSHLLELDFFNILLSFTLVDSAGNAVDKALITALLEVTTGAVCGATSGVGGGAATAVGGNSTRRPEINAALVDSSSARTDITWDRPSLDLIAFFNFFFRLSLSDDADESPDFL